MSAGIVALYLAKSSERIRLRGYCGIRMVVGGGVDPVDIFSICVTNVGTRATVINNIGMSVGQFKKRHAVLTVGRDTYSVGIPYAITDGQVGQWGIPLGEDKGFLRNLCRDFINTESDVKTLQFTVHTNHGQHLTLKPEEELKKALLGILGEGKRQPPDDQRNEK